VSDAAWGPQRLAPDRTRFRLWAPACDTVTLEIKGAAPLAMMRGDGGWFAVDAPVGAGTLYRFRIAADVVVSDPASRAQHDSVHGWSVVVDPDAYVWKNPDWAGRPWHETVIQERHVGIDGGFRALSGRLGALAETGITALEIMPVAAFSGARNWGYDGVLPYAPAAAYGSPDDLKALVDTAHGLGLMAFLDVVYNHFGPDGNYIGAYAPEFFDDRRQTPWGGAIAFGREQVARYFIDNARMWIEEYRFDGLRLDAVHAIDDDLFLDDLAAAVRAGAGERHVHLILENERNDAARLAPGKFDAQWNDDFHNTMHVLLTGETQAYYADFAERPAAKLARCLNGGFVYQGDSSPHHDGAARGTPSDHLPPMRFVDFLQNHDQIGNRAMGERLIRLTTASKLRAATTLLLLCPHIPLLFMGEEWGSDAPFLFFTDFHDDLADAVRNGRRAEFAKFPAFSDPLQRDGIPDPNARETFERSCERPGADGAMWNDLHRALLGLRRDRIIPRLASATGLGADVIGDKAVIARWQLGGERLTIAINLDDAPAAVTVPPEPLLHREGDLINNLLQPDSCVAWLG
jgi:maltooligosyltrehalose trehalohydrolase